MVGGVAAIDTVVEERLPAPAEVSAQLPWLATRREGRVRIRLRAPSPDALILYGSFAIAMALTFGFSPDDPFVALRYAWNLVHGNGLVFNAGQHVNGATSPAGLVLGVLAVASPLGHAYLKLKLLSLVFGLLTLQRARKLAESLIQDRWVRWLALIAIGSSSPIAVSSASGLETTIDSFAIVGLLVELCSQRAFRRPARAAGLASLAVLARPEAILVVAAVAAVGVVTERGCPIWKRVAWALGPAASEGFLLVSNRAYYGSWLPNTFYAKQLPPARASTNGWNYLIGTIHPKAVVGWSGAGGTAAFKMDGYLLGTLFALFLIGAVMALFRWRSRGYLLAALAAQALFVWRLGGDWMGGARFLEPVIVVLYVLQATGIAAVARLLARHIRTRLIHGIAFGLILATSVYQYAPAGAHDTIKALTGGVDDRSLLRAGGYGNYSEAWAESPVLLECARPGSVVAMTEVGFGAFARPDLRVLDLRGLTNSQIAHSAPASMKHAWGVEDDSWWKASSTVGAVILRDQPVLIVTADGGPAAALGGRYVRVGTFGGHSQISLLGQISLYERSGTHCTVDRRRL